MHVMMLAMDYPPAVFAGIGVHAHGLAKALSALGADVDVFVVPHAETIASGKYRVEVDGRITVYRFEFDYEDTEAYRSRNLPTRRELRNIIWNVSTANVVKPILDIALAKDYDVIHMHDYFNVIVAAHVHAHAGAFAYAEIPGLDLRGRVPRVRHGRRAGRVHELLSRRAAPAQGRRARVAVPALPGGADHSDRPFRPHLDARPAPLRERGRMNEKFDGKRRNIVLSAEKN